jgi:hypothetical protein
MNHKKILVGIGSAVVVVAVVSAGFVFFNNHYLPTTTVEGLDVKIGMMNVANATTKVTKVNQSNTITLKGNGNTQVIKVADRYQVSTTEMSSQLKKRSVTLTENPDYLAAVQTSLSSLTFKNETPSTDATIKLSGKTFKVVAAKTGTTVDKDKLTKKILADVKANKSDLTYQLSDFYVEPTVKSDNADLLAKVKKLNKNGEKLIKLTFADQSAELTPEQISTLITSSGDVDQAALTDIINGFDTKYGTLNQPVIFTDVHGQKRQYTNNGAYGWGIDTAKSVALVTTALENDQKEQTIDLPIVGNKDQQSTISGTYVEVDLDNQEMHFFKDGQQIVDTSVITGRFNKGTATVPGFHTILYAAKDQTLKGADLDGTTYAVPVKYWMPLESKGGVVTQIGIHDADYKAEYFGNKEAYKTTLGSNGCVNTPGDQVVKIFENAYAGLPVIIYGHIYDSAPGEFDKPVEYGTPIS